MLERSPFLPCIQFCYFISFFALKDLNLLPREAQAGKIMEKGVPDNQPPFPACLIF